MKQVSCMKETNLTTPRVKTPSKTGAQNQQTGKSAERKERRLTMETIKVKRWVSQRLANKAPVKLLGGLAAGAMLLAGTAFIYQELNQDKAASPPARSETTTAYSVPEQDILFDELSASFIGVPAVSSGESTQAFQPPADAGPGDLSEGSFRIREEQRAADRQDDLRDMTRYWDQLKWDATSGSTSYYDEDENERAYDELRQNLTGVPYSDSSGDDLAVDPAWQPFGSLLPDTEYYRSPDFNDRQMRPSSK
jgi:hypothetical protein